MNYPETLKYLYNSLPMFQRIGKAAYKSDLKTTLALDKHFNHPHHNFKSVHIAGTNGKGSVSHMLASVLQEAGYKTGLYTSPHLKDFRERIRINGHPIRKDAVVQFVADNRDIFESIQPSFFEMTVAMAFHYFSQEEVDIAIVEVGMGGRLDSTNILSPGLSVITNIGHDHMEYLGSELSEIAGEKAGIIKSGVPVVIGESNLKTNDIFIAKAREKGCDIHFADQHFTIPYSFYTNDHKQSLNVYHGGDLQFENLVLDQLGLYQRSNVITTLMSLDQLKSSGFSIPVEVIYSGMANVKTNTGFLGRWQVLVHQPLIICDTGHNLEGIQSVVSQIDQTPYKKLWMVIGTVDDKNIDSILDIWPKEAFYFFTQAGIPRAMNAEKLAQKAEAAGLKGKVIPNVKDAADKARSMAGPEDLVFIGGSTFVVAEVL